MRAAQSIGTWRTGPSDVFGVLARDRNELSHSRMLAWLLDPLGHHGLHIDFSAELLAAARLPVPSDLDQSVVRIEVSRTESRADVVVELASGGFVIENRIDAVEGPEQCARIANDYPSDAVGLIFLTPSGRPPITAGTSAERWRSLSWRDARRAREHAAGSGSAAGRYIVDDYLSTLRRIFR